MEFAAKPDGRDGNARRRSAMNKMTKRELHEFTAWDGWAGCPSLKAFAEILCSALPGLEPQPVGEFQRAWSGNELPKGRR